MSHKPEWGLFLFVLVMAAESAFGLSPCPTSVLQGANAKISNDLICVMPQVYGPGGLVGSNNGGPLNPTHGHEVHFQASTVRSFEPINSEIGIELSQLPIASPVAGFIFTGGAISPTESFGPVLTDRAETIDRHKFFIGASYQYFNFDKVDGVDLKNFGAVLTHEPEPTLCVTFPSIPCQNGEPIFTHDIVATQNRIDLRVHQMTFVATFGLTGRLDVSVAVPVLDVRMGLTSSSTIFNFEPPPVNHALDLTTPVATESIPDPNDPYHAIFSNFHSKLGIGDVTLRTKLQAWQWASTCACRQGMLTVFLEQARGGYARSLLLRILDGSRRMPQLVLKSTGTRCWQEMSPPSRSQNLNCRICSRILPGPILAWRAVS